MIISHTNKLSLTKFKKEEETKNKNATEFKVVKIYSGLKKFYKFWYTIKSQIYNTHRWIQSHFSYYTIFEESSG